MALLIFQVLALFIDNTDVVHIRLELRALHFLVASPQLISFVVVKVFVYIV